MGICTIQAQSCLAHDSLELINLYNSTNGANWLKFDDDKGIYDFSIKWDLTKSVSTWSGVSLTEDSCSVKSIDLSNSNLKGSIPNLNLPNLQELNLYRNKLSGSIPEFNLPNLQELNLYRNKLSGSIPEFNLPNLQELNLYRNKLSGSIPEFNLPNLQELNLSKNQLSGDLSALDLPSLRRLNLINNQLSGAIPNFEHSPNLTLLYLYNNKLSGAIPNFNHLKELDTLEIRKNRFTFQGIEENLKIQYFRYGDQWTIPIYKSKGSTLYVDADGGVKNNTYTWYKGNNWRPYKTIKGDSTLTVTESGRYYCEVTNSAVANLTLHSNAIDVDACSLKLSHGSLELVNLYNATNGDKWENKWDLSQPVSTWSGVSLTEDGCSVKSIDLSDKGLSGQIPNLDLSNLQKLNLSNNQLSGTVPDFNDLESLDTLDIRNNNFTFQGIPNSINISTFEYSPQNNIPITRNGNTLYVKAGGKLENNTYYWYKDGVEYKTIVGDSLLIVKESVSYYCKVTNSTVKRLTLQSDAIYVDVCSLKHDSLKLVNLYNATNGDQWENKWDLTKSVSTWSGIGFTKDGCSVKSIDLSDKGLSGQIPNLNLPNLESLDLSNNQLSGGAVHEFNYLDTLDIRNNNFTFQDIPSSINISTFKYSPQNNIPISSEGDTLYVKAGGKIENNTYTWYKDDAKYKTIVGDSLLIATESGSYYCKVTNKTVANLTLQSDAISVKIKCSLILEKDRLELINLYNATNGGEWVKWDKGRYDFSIKWDLTKSVSTWSGITLTDDGCSVKNIDLSNSNLKGSIPNLNLPNLQELNLSGNLSGKPNSSENQLSGSIPKFNLPNLQKLNLSRNKLSGSIPKFNLPNLQELNLSENQLSGDLSALDLPSLRRLNLINNQLSGAIPNFEHSLNLTSLYFYNNKLSGAIPNFNHLKELDTLEIGKNRFTFQGIEENLNIQYFRYKDQSNIPIYKSKSILYVKAGGGVKNKTYTWYRWSRPYKTSEGDSTLAVTESGTYYCKVTNSTVEGLTLKSDAIYVDICSLKLNHDSLELVNLYKSTNGDQWNNPWDLTKRIYKKTFNDYNINWKGITLTKDACNVREIRLGSKKLSGKIPNLDLPELKVLDLHNNNLKDSIPKFDSLPNLTELILNKNELSGSIPDFNLPRLETLILFDNQLSGSIPDFDLPRLKTLFLFDNQLSGSIPDFKNLGYQSQEISFNLSKNQLSGSIPNFTMSKLGYIDLSNNELSGSIPNFNLQELRYLILNNNQLSGPVPNFNSTLIFDYNHYSGLNIRNNNFVFEDLAESEILEAKGLYYYIPQNSIPIYKEKGKLYVKAGGYMSKNTYTPGTKTTLNMEKQLKAIAH